MKPYIDLYLVSGFLGAGKTTFLQQMLKNFSDKKVGIIVNEFGAVSIDGKILKQDGIRLVEINNGSIFCSCLKSNFVSTLMSFRKQPVDILLIENSGLADPSNMQRLLGELKENEGRPYNYRGSVCIIDPVHFLKNVQILSPVQNQVTTSNLIVINKMDLAEKSALESVEKKVLELNPQAVIYKTSFGMVPLEILEKKLFDSGYAADTSNNVFNRPAAYSIESEGVFEKEGLYTLIHKIQPYIYRIKGFMMAKSGWWKIDVVEDQVKIEYQEPSDKSIQETSKLVVIGKDSVEFIDLIEHTWRDLFSSEMYIYE